MKEMLLSSPARCSLVSTRRVLRLLGCRDERKGFVSVAAVESVQVIERFCVIDSWTSHTFRALCCE
jgi:hypothetical protein